MNKHLQYGHRCEICSPERGSNSPLTGPVFGRRHFLQLAGAGVAGFMLSPLAGVQAAEGPSISGKARNCIFILMAGAPSGVDTFDLKVGSWTPADFNPTTYNNVLFPQGLMPNLASQLGQLAIIRSMRAPALVHPLQQTWAQIARSPSSALGKVAPNIGSVVALEFEAQREAGQKLPVFVSLNTNGNVVGPGYFNGLYSPFDITASPTGLGNLSNPDGQSVFESRYAVLSALDSGLRGNSPLGGDVGTMSSFYERGRSMMYDPKVEEAFRFTAEEQDRYGNTGFGNSCIVARNLLKGDQGTRFVHIRLDGWDHHQDIYDRVDGIYPMARSLDSGLGKLLEDLAALPGKRGGTLLAETLVVAMGEFGRTVGPLTGQNGRDHFFQHFAVLAGGGVGGGRIIGETTADGSTTKEPGWSQNRPVAYEDIAATIYSALGIDYTKKLNDDPIGRGFEYVPFASEGAWYPVVELFSRDLPIRQPVVPRSGSNGRRISG